MVSKSGAGVNFFPVFPYFSDHVPGYKVGMTVSSEDNVLWRQKGSGCFGVGSLNYLEVFLK